MPLENKNAITLPGCHPVADADATAAEAAAEGATVTAAGDTVAADGAATRAADGAATRAATNAFGAGTAPVAPAPTAATAELPRPPPAADRAAAAGTRTHPDLATPVAEARAPERRTASRPADPESDCEASVRSGATGPRPVSAAATPAAAPNATPIPNVTAPAPSHLYGATRPRRLDEGAPTDSWANESDRSAWGLVTKISTRRHRNRQGGLFTDRTPETRRSTVAHSRG